MESRHIVISKHSVLLLLRSNDSWAWVHDIPFDVYEGLLELEVVLQLSLFFRLIEEEGHIERVLCDVSHLE